MVNLISCYDKKKLEEIIHPTCVSWISTMGEEQGFKLGFEYINVTSKSYMERQNRDLKKCEYNQAEKCMVYFLYMKITNMKKFLKTLTQVFVNLCSMYTSYDFSFRENKVFLFRKSMMMSPADGDIFL